jgi:hypothetical protein
VKWYTKSAEQGNAGAQNNLGYMYEKGDGVPQDYAEAVKWYKKSAEQGNAYAQNNIGHMYEKGRGVPKEYMEAHKWYNLAAARSPDESERDKSLKNRNTLASKMTPAQIMEAQKLAREWKLAK